MQEEIELEVNKNYVVPLSGGRKLLIGRQDDGYRPGAGIMLIDRNGDIEDLVLAEGDNSTFGCSTIHHMLFTSTCGAISMMKIRHTRKSSKDDENDAKEKARDLTFNQFQWNDDNCDCDIIPQDAEEIEEA